MSSRASGGKIKRKIWSRSMRSGVLFPVGRTERYLRRITHKFRISAAAPIYTAAVLEYLTGLLNDCIYQFN